MKDNYSLLGKYIRQVDERNKTLKIDKLLGVSIGKKFIPSIANTVGTDFSSYKIVRHGQFAYGPVTSRNGEKVSIALLEEDDCIISSSYTVFEITDTNQLMPEYLMLWFMRPEFDRYARFKSHGSVREIFDWEQLCNVELPVPSIEKQHNIVKAYKAITDRIALKQRINDNLAASCMTEFMRIFAQNKEYNNEAGSWFNMPLGHALSRVAMGPFGSNIKTDCFVDSGVPVLNGNNIAGLILNDSSYRYVTFEKATELKNSIASNGDLVITHRGTLGQIALIPPTTRYPEYVISQSQFLLRCNEEVVLPEYLLFYFHTDAGKRRLLANDNTTGVPSIAKPTSYIKKIRIPLPPIELQQRWGAVTKQCINYICNNNKEIDALLRLASLQLTGLSR